MKNILQLEHIKALTSRTDFPLASRSNTFEDHKENFVPMATVELQLLYDEVS